MIDLAAMEAATEQAMQEPQVGDRFHEMFTYWVYVVDLGVESVTVIVGGGHPSRFRRAYAYGSIPGYSVTLPGIGKVQIFTTRDEFLADRGSDVSGWLSRCPALELEER